MRVVEHQRRQQPDNRRVVARPGQDALSEQCLAHGGRTAFAVQSEQKTLPRNFLYRPDHAFGLDALRKPLHVGEQAVTLDDI